MAIREIPLSLSGPSSGFVAASNDTTGVTDRTTINAKILETYNKGGGQVVLGVIGGEVFTVDSPILMYPFVDLVGANRNTTIKLANGANSDVLSVPSFATLTHSGAASFDTTTITSGPYDFAIRRLTLDGNRANQTAGEGVRIYGWNYILEDLRIQNCFGNGLYTEWGIISGSAVLPGIEPKYTNLQIHDNGRHGWHHCGPSDAQCLNPVIWANNKAGNACGIGLWIDSDGVSNDSGTFRFTAGGFQCVNAHVWGAHSWGIVADASGSWVNCESEAALVGQVLLRTQSQWIGGDIFYVTGQTYATGMGMQLGDAAATAGLGTTPNVDPQSKSLFANASKIVLSILGPMADQTSRAGLNWVHAGYSQVDGTVFAYIIPSAQVAAGSNGVDVSTWTGGSPGTLQIGTYANYLHLPPGGGTATVVTALGTVTFTYTGMTGQYTSTETLTGCVAQGSPAGGSTVATGAVVTIPSSLLGSKFIAGTIDATSTCRVQAGGYGSTASETGTSTKNYGGAFGDGSDGAVVLDGTATVAWATKVGSVYTMTKDCFCSSLTINVGVTLIAAGFYIFGGALVTGPGTISYDGAAGAANGTAGAALVGTTYGNAGGAGNIGAGSAGGVTANTLALGMGFGGAGGVGFAGASGAAGNQTTGPTFLLHRTAAIQAGLASYGGVKPLAGGGGGGGGGGDGVVKGGGGGAAANGVFIFAQKVNNVTINARGGAGGAPASGNAGGGGGGAGGGGVVVTLTGGYTSVTAVVTGGGGGAGSGTGTAGAAGSAGGIYNPTIA